MAASSKNPHASIKARNKLAGVIAQDPKKAVVLSILVAVMLGMWAKVLFKGKSGPSQAVASTTTAAAAGTPGNAGASAADARGRAYAELQTWLARDPAPLTRNLFAVKFDYFQQERGKLDPRLRAPDGNGFWDKLAKSMTDRADQRKEQQILVENLRLQAAQLRLQTILMGASPKALINDSLVGEGDVVAKSDFRVLKIEARRVIVEQKGIKLAIQMK